MEYKSVTKISSLITKYLKVNKRIEVSTADLTDRAFRYLLLALDNRMLDDLTLADAEEFQAYLIDLGLSRTSVNIYVKSISPVFNWAVERGMCKSNPFARLKKFKITKKRPQIFTPFEIERILKVCPDKIWQARIVLGLTSLRKGEVLNLTINDVDFVKGLVFVEPKAETAYTWRWHPKDYEQRTLPLIPQLSKLLLELYEKLPNGQPYLLLKPQRYSYLLRNRQRMNDRTRKNPDNNFGRTFKNICQRALVGGCFHNLRKTALTQLTSGLRLQEVQELAGHSSVETTRSYLASRDDVLTRAGDIISRGVAQFG